MRELTTKLVKRHKTNCPFTIARELNINISFDDLGENTRGFYYRVLKRRYICIHKDLSDEWKRFVCAHELGHDRLHKGVSQFFVDEHSFFLPGKLERQANEFAVHLLLNGVALDENDTVTSLLARTGIPCEMKDYIRGR
ncbi:ImmA/IrrE family metallo-endopeptidase [Paenibacillus sp. Cedars]|uniref:ImmA/IrrE family metallo-endopeptidase n=1 Tax=Paenibacillus sp. Cedars TaxID=1980674 RepID=UPI0011622B7D|nr:ImmA/IrrE family metallo-endopeptidase [Paenibacillus sp. Cedars]AWP28756.1 ImmA/IrrE family metallo-endopeptidase [Paenibacillus sp. Cedars]